MISDNNNNLAKVYLNIKEKEKIIKGYWCLELGFFCCCYHFLCNDPNSHLCDVA